MKARLLIHLFAIANSASISDRGARLNRLRYFIDQVKEYTREDATADVVDAEVSAQLVQDAVEFAQGSSRDAEVVFHAMGILCRNPVARRQVDNVMWAAVDALCLSGPVTTTVEPVETTTLTQASNSLEIRAAKRSSPKRVHFADDLIEPSEASRLTGDSNSLESRAPKRSLERVHSFVIEASSSLEVVETRAPMRTSKRVHFADDRIEPFQCVSSVATEPASSSSHTAASSSLEAIEFRSPQVTPTRFQFEDGLIDLHERSLKRRCLEDPRDYENIRAKLEPYFSVEGGIGLYVSPTRGMIYIAHKHVRLVEAKAYTTLMHNLNFLEQTDIAADRIAFLFHHAYSILIGLSHGATDAPEVDALVEEGDAFVKRPFDEREFLRHMKSEFCSNGSGSSAQPQPHSVIPRKLAAKVVDGDLRSLRTNIEFLELAGVGRQSLAGLLGEACRLLFIH